MPTEPTQLELRPRTWGGRRPGAGRPVKANKAHVPHRPRPDHKPRHPVHATMRFRDGLPTLRGKSLFKTLKGALSAASRPAFRVVHFSVQNNHLHLIVEAHDRPALSRGLQGLAIRVARAVNNNLGCRGQAVPERYHARALKTPREVRHALCYVLQNWRKHGPPRDPGAIDACSSGPWFDGWRTGPPPCEEDLPVAPGRTWLVTTGWRRAGLLDPGEAPRS